MRKIIAYIERIFWQCILCNNAGEYVCTDCRKKYFQPNHECISLKYFDRIDLGYIYNDKISELIKELKYEGFFRIGFWLGVYLARRIRPPVFAQSEITAQVLNILIPVPLASEKLKARGFNQAWQLAAGIESVWQQNQQVKILQLVERVKNTRTQVGMNRLQRQLNLTKAFRVDNKYWLSLLDLVNKNSINKINIYIVDDVYTTGTTISEIGETLQSYLKNYKLELGEKYEIKIFGLIFAKR